MHGEIVHSARPKRVHPRVAPHVAAVPPVLTQFEVVEVWGRAILENCHHFMLRAVEASHAGVVLDPDGDVLELVKHLSSNVE